MLGTILPALMSSAVLSPHHLILHIAQLCACHICSIASSTHPQEVRGSILCWSPIFKSNYGRRYYCLERKIYCQIAYSNYCKSVGAINKNLGAMEFQSKNLWFKPKSEDQSKKLLIIFILCASQLSDLTNPLVHLDV